MAGTNQAVNLTGMLTNMANSIGAMPDISGLTANIQGMSQPTLNANDPDSLEKYAKWAESTGKREEAAEYRKQAAQLRRERSTMKRAAVAAEKSTMGRTAASQGDVRGTQLQLAELQKQMGQADTPQEQAAIRAEMRSLEALLPDAQKIEKSNKANGVLKLEQLIESGQLDEAQVPKAREGINRLMSDPEIARDVNKLRVQEVALQKEMASMEADKYLADNQRALTEAIAAQDESALTSILANAPQGASGKVQAVVNSQLNIEQSAAKWRAERQKMATPLDLANPEETYGGLPEAFSKPIMAAYRAAADYQKKNFKDGMWTSESALTRARELEQTAKSVARQFAAQYAATEGARVMREETRVAQQVLSLELSRLEPIPDVDVQRRARIIVGVDNDGKPKPVTEQAFVEAKSQLAAERDEAVRVKLAVLRGEDPEQVEESVGDQDDGGFSVKLDNGVVITRALVQSRKKAGASISAKSLSDAYGITIGQANALLDDFPEPAASVDFSMPSRATTALATERELERMRSRLTPMSGN